MGSGHSRVELDWQEIAAFAGHRLPGGVAQISLEMVVGRAGAQEGQLVVMVSVMFEQVCAEERNGRATGLASQGFFSASIKAAGSAMVPSSRVSLRFVRFTVRPVLSAVSQNRCGVRSSLTWQPRA